MKTIILAGGLGTRLSEETQLRPKPMVEIGGLPILWHIMKLYAASGLTEFVVALGYKGEVIKDFFLNLHARANDLSVHLKTGDVVVHGRQQPDWTVHLVDTGPRTETGGRIARLRSWVDGGTFLLTYGDGVADIDVAELVAFHRAHGRLATVTAVHPPARFGELVASGDQVTEFREKPQTADAWINGGFFVLEPGIFDYLADDECIWEREPLEALARDGQLMSYRHRGFWHPMDTLRDKRLLEELWSSGEAPWKR
ncbi:MAG TPA: glucose-1-phosphate cytidylyltransferase [Longimicrobium sp.]|nr:glucose-1-phosphate cytidylyltransferase [Longimicrobium sp.]